VCLFLETVYAGLPITRNIVRTGTEIIESLVRATPIVVASPCLNSYLSILVAVEPIKI